MKSKLDYIYDYEYDLMDITINQSFEYKNSIEMTNGIILDLDENGFPAAIEIISASKILGIDKQNLISPDIDIGIISNDELIYIQITFTYSVFQQEHYVCVKQNLTNNYGIPAMETIFSTA